MELIWCSFYYSGSYSYLIMQFKSHIIEEVERYAEYTMHNCKYEPYPLISWFLSSYTHFSHCRLRRTSRVISRLLAALNYRADFLHRVHLLAVEGQKRPQAAVRATQHGHENAQLAQSQPPPMILNSLNGQHRPQSRLMLQPYQLLPSDSRLFASKLCTNFSQHQLQPINSSVGTSSLFNFSSHSSLSRRHGK
jgi:hypothetical protein